MDASSGWSFRRRARAWLNAVSRDSLGRRPQSIRADGTRVLILDSGRLSQHQTIDSFVLVRGDFTCDSGCRFLRPVYVAGNCEIGRGTIIETIEVDGDLYLSPSVEIRGNATSLGAMEIRSGCRIMGAAVSHRSIRLGLEASASRLYAPMVLTPEGVAATALSRPEVSGRAIPITSPASPPSRGLLKIAGIAPNLLAPADSSTWVCESDLHCGRPILLKTNLVVHGTLSLAAGSLIEGRIETRRGLSVGPGSLVIGDLQAGGDLHLGRGSIFQGDIESRQMVRLEFGVRGLRAGAPVQVFSAGELVLDQGVVVRGRVSSSCRVTAAATEVLATRHRAVGESIYRV